MPASNENSSLDPTALLAEIAALRERNELLSAVIYHCPAVIFVKDPAGRLLVCNRTYENLAGADPGGLIGKNDHEIFGPEAGQQNRENDLRVCASGAPQEVEELIPQRDGMHVYLSVKFPLYDGTGELYGIGGVATDITERRRAEEERNALQERVIEVQRSVLSELSTPIVPIADGVIALPLIGTIDDERGRNIMQALLDGVTEHRARAAILDVTGVRSVDGQVASGLLQSVRAARLLGTKVIVTGIRPEVAQAMVGLDADWSGVQIFATMRDAVAWALSREPRR
ncbi:PAS domain-containing protein [Nannocystis radixulma]|uniref:PAS domain-containing protein n=2 Tax=Nannocystis radixulma TaxID=2995305 RepID=A0ABT5BBV3_9BACT|nr:PAS domain-containing protein [Nannocystis radixulma]MDC0671615.1 PAS domain-containing protein [Nannocystis radixulma]